MATRSGRYVNTQPTPDNFVALWNAIAAAQARLDSAFATLEEQAATIVTLQEDLDTATATANEALIAAGKSYTSQPGAGDGGGGGGGGSGDAHPNHYQAVVDAKAELVALGEDLSGPCGAFKITRRVAQMLAPSEPESGLLDKPTGTNCMSYAVDIICYNDGIIYDILIDAGGTNEPSWNFNGTVDPARWRPSF